MDTVIDTIILGAGPAGLQMAHFLQESNRDYLVLEASDHAGSFFKQFPRHRQLISINKRYTGSSDSEMNLRMDWNSLLSNRDNLKFGDFSEDYFPNAATMVNYLNQYAESCGLKIRYGTRITRIAKDPLFRLHDTDGNCFACKKLIIATGVSRENFMDVPGVELVESYSEVSVDPKDFINQRVLILGKGNSAFETADNLIGTSAAVHVAGRSPIRLAWKTHFVGHLRAVNNNLLDTYQLKSQNAILDGNVTRIEKRGDKFAVRFSFIRANEVEKELIYDRVISCTGFRFDHSIFDDNCKPELAIDDRFPAQTASWESVNVPDLFFAGTIMQQRDYRKSTSGFIHGFRYCVRSLFRMLEQRYYQQTWPSERMALNASRLSKAVIDRVNRTSALWQQFEFLGDLILINKDHADYLQELPVDYIHQTHETDPRDYYIVTLEYGPDHSKVDPFDIEIARVAQNDAEQAINAQYLHPVIRHYRQGRQIGEHHLAENLENEWNDKQAHEIPLFNFFNASLNLQEPPNNIEAATLLENEIG